MEETIWIHTISKKVVWWKYCCLHFASVYLIQLQQKVSFISIKKHHWLFQNAFPFAELSRCVTDLKQEQLNLLCKF